ncbi:MAG: DUF4350 domain-containing protein [Deltaproteobacteria bacterium]|nr:DUF4350 domain-containing protein [Deltaproteobacteria bacterium]
MGRAGNDRTTRRAGTSAAVCLALLAAAPARADEADASPDVPAEGPEAPDYAPVRAWNGLGRFVELAQSLGIAVDVVPQDVLPLDPATSLVLVYPETAPDGSALAEFVAAGGRLLVADDYGLGAGALAPLGLLRVAGPAAPGAAFRGNPDFPVAVPLVPHPVLEGVGAVVTNHPAALGAGPGGRCLLGFHAPPPACLLAEASLGYGTALALADPSVLIDLMLEVDGNRRLAAGLLRYLTTNRRARIVLALPAAAWAVVQPPPVEGVGWRGALRRWLAGLSEPLAAAPPWLWALLALAGLLLAAAPWLRPPTREDLASPRLLHWDRGRPATAWPPPSVPEAYAAFAREAVERMHVRIVERRGAAEQRLREARRDGARLGRRLRLRLERTRLAGLERRLRVAADDAGSVPGVERLRRLAHEFVKADREAPR